MPSQRDLPDRVAAALDVCHLVFTEGYSRTSGEALLDVLLAEEAIRLVRQLYAALPDHAEVAGALALMLLTHARSPARARAPARPRRRRRRREAAVSDRRPADGEPAGAAVPQPKADPVRITTASRPVQLRSPAASARRYNYWLGGKDNFAADRESGDAVAAIFPSIRTAVIENRYFLVLSHSIGDYLPPEAVRTFHTAPVPVYLRTHDEVTRFFDGLRPVDSGVVSISNWRAGQEPEPRPAESETATDCGVARIP
jgi:hypothetical protein